MQQTVNIEVRGKVQGVFFRQSTRDKALELSLTGFVRNRDDGAVEICATGQPSQIDKLIAWCQVGPSRARVEEVVSKSVGLQTFENFSINK